MKAKLKALFHHLQTVTLLRLSDDLRKGAYLMGLGLVGIILSSDNVSVFEGIFLFLFGAVVWIIGHLCAYYADVKSKHMQGEKK
ncbi:hypothetical protein L4F92_07315 [Avibacterium sp. 21-595]|uniref:hypothetical protein n=1 Tax=Avibacterium sp. 21-595 TaxID=2911527 RepID=UPI00202653CF|nr:hypothetical protein [Avibacterium sp. 21-595]URL05881.1 hypothetical protein L4F92_07315 [Avibacterium sp. 21-595]